jgi:hypothetical protein
LSVYFLLDIEAIRDKPTENIPHTCNHFKGKGKSEKLPYNVSVPKECQICGRTGRTGKVDLRFGKLWTCAGCAKFLREKAMGKIRQLFTDGFFFQVYCYTGEPFYEAVKKRFDRAGAISQGIVNFTDKMFVMISDINANGGLSFANWKDPLGEALLNKFLAYDPKKPKNRNKVRVSRRVREEGEMKGSKKELTHYNFIVYAKNEEEIYQAFEKMGCRVNRQRGEVEYYSDEALQFFWAKAKAKQEGRVFPIFDTDNCLQTATILGRV